ncbi:hypothetical protein [Hymenobacter cellulosilyticus]|uniref:DUF922 domain-containing protein n=1 Tax=Hymenobacter cellulosilyticus TaxID=2932248 RepID=A0A8T9QCJ3_9BACT|nr:hypothetical protein [Hymenobacter cellulosilyticus]UOQ73560.1 hypothetical protein MUN79_06415 [Hymenobacter cellulosilyticus]
MSRERVIPHTFLAATTEANAVVYQVPVDATHFNVFVRVEFDRAASWVNKAREFDRKQALAHEQLHFDITELTARKMRRLIAAFKKANKDLVGSEMKTELACLYAEEFEMNIRYDEETNVPEPDATQAKWNAHVARYLQQLSEFKSTPMDCIVP